MTQHDAEEPRRIYYVICGATAAYRAPGLIRALRDPALEIITLQTPSAVHLLSPRELARVPGHRQVSSYFDDALLPRPKPGVILVAPCTFNSLNKLANGTPDNLPLSLATEAIGRGWPVLVAPSLNDGLWAHPRRAQAMDILSGWGVSLLLPRPEDNYAMAPDDLIVAGTRNAAGRV